MVMIRDHVINHVFCCYLEETYVGKQIKILKVLVLVPPQSPSDAFKLPFFNILLKIPFLFVVVVWKINTFK